MSQFLKYTDEFPAGQTAGIDFDNAVKLPGGGSTCTIYKTRWQRRDVFVKRLKEEFRAKPLYLDALDKEFDIGVNLRHPSLPEYREFHRDYIVMDFIDGMTLAGMIEREAPWLQKELNIISMLRQLVDVVDYLHSHNVVHCDIKPDNIMITANNRNLVLIDFDKSYTDALGDTSGHPARYGLSADYKGRVAIDFRGIGMVVEKLKRSVPGFRFRRFRRFVRACNRPDADCTELAAILDYTPASLRKRNIIAVGATVTVAALLTVAYLSNFNGKSTAVDGIIEEPADTLRNVIEIPHEATGGNVAEPTPITPGDASSSYHDETDPYEAEENPDDPAGPRTRLEILDDALRPYFRNMIAGLDELDRLRANRTLSIDRLTEGWSKYQQIETRSFNEMVTVVSNLSEQYPDSGFTSLINSTKSCITYLMRANVSKKEFMAEINRRSKND